MKLVSSNEWNSYCYHYSCFYQAKVTYENEEYDLTINSASYMIIENEKAYLILNEKNNLFLEACNCCE